MGEPRTAENYCMSLGIAFVRATFFTVAAYSPGAADLLQVARQDGPYKPPCLACHKIPGRFSRSRCGGCRRPRCHCRTSVRRSCLVRGQPRRNRRQQSRAGNQRAIRVVRNTLSAIDDKQAETACTRAVLPALSSLSQTELGGALPVREATLPLDVDGGLETLTQKPAPGSPPECRRPQPSRTVTLLRTMASVHASYSLGCA